jgi:phosphoglycerate dehydrogenase-like enzyme
MKLVVHPPIDEQRLVLLREVAGNMRVVNCSDVDAARAEIVDADAFFGKMTPQLLAAAKELRWVQSPTASLEHYLFPELIEHPCVVTNMRGLFYDVIADHVMGFVLCFARNLHTYIRQQLKRQWEPVGGETQRRSFLTGPGVVNAIDQAHQHLSDCHLGVIGVGSIGSEICRRASAFGMQVVGVDPVCQEVPLAVPEVWPLSRMDDLLRQSDFVVIAAPHTPLTEKLFRAEQFRTMKSTAVLINIGRGIIVDLADLTSALQNGDIAGAALDVFETEPLPRDHPLWGMDNVIITPHIAAASVKVPDRHTETLLENTRRFVAGDELFTPVNKREWF